MNGPVVPSPELISIKASDLRDIVSGFVEIAEDSLHRSMEFNRNKISALAFTLNHISMTLDQIIEQAERLEHKALRP